MANLLGIPGRCKTHRVMIYDRGGFRRVGEAKSLSQVVWNRDRDGVSEASFTIEGGRRCERARSFLEAKGISTKRHELVIFRGDERVWEGPLFRISDEGSQVKIFAKDVCSYLFSTMLSKDYDNRPGSAEGVIPMTTRIGNMINYELVTDRMGRRLGGGDPVLLTAWENLSPAVNLLPHLDVRHFPNEAETAAFTRAFQMTVGTYMAGAARTSGIDYAAIGRRIMLWDTSRGIGRTRTLTEADFYGDIITTEYGADHTQASYVTGQEGVFGEAINPENLEFYGPWSTAFTAYNEEGSEAPTIGALNSQAARNVSGRSPVPFEVRVPDNSSIRLSEGLGISDLTPGVQIPLLATMNGRKRNQLQKLDHLTVVETPEREDIKVTMSPASRSDSDIEVP